MIKRIIFLVLMTVFASGCDFGSSDKIMDEQTYEDIFIELAFLDQFDEKLLNDISKEEMRTQIFDHYGVTSEQFRIAHEHYQSRVDEQLDRLERIGERIREERDKVNEAERKFKEADKDELDSLRQSLRNR